MSNASGPMRGSWAALITALREAAGMSKAELGRRLGKDRGTVHRWETGQTKPDSPEVAEQLANLFGLDLEETLILAGLMPPREKPVTPPPPPLDPDLKILVRRLADPRTPDEVKAFIRATLRYLAELPPPPRRGGERREDVS